MAEFDSTDAVDSFLSVRGWQYDNGWSYEGASWDSYCSSDFAWNTTEAGRPGDFIVILFRPPGLVRCLHYRGFDAVQVWAGAVSTAAEFEAALAATCAYVKTARGEDAEAGRVSPGSEPAKGAPPDRPAPARVVLPLGSYQDCCEQARFVRHADPSVADAGKGGPYELTIGACANCARILVDVHAMGVTRWVTVGPEFVEKIAGIRDPETRRNAILLWCEGE